MQHRIAVSAVVFSLIFFVSSLHAQAFLSADQILKQINDIQEQINALNGSTAPQVLSATVGPSISLVNPVNGSLVSGPSQTIQGKYVIQHTDHFDTGTDTNIPAVEDSTSGNTYSLLINGQAPTITPESTVSVTGIVSGSNMITSSAINQSQGTVGFMIARPPIAASFVSGSSPSTLHVAVILLNFKDAPSPFSPTEATQFMNQVSTDYVTNSYGKFNVSSTIFGPYNTLFMTTGSCDWNSYAASAINFFKFYNNGRDPRDLYDKVSFFFPPNNTCGNVAGRANSSGGDEIWIVGKKPASVFDHELGHTITIDHSHSENCGNAQAPAGLSGCTSIEYGDQFDVMGNNSLGISYFNPPDPMNALQRIYLGWLPLSNILSVSQPGIYTINSLETPSNSTQALAVSFNQVRSRSQLPNYVEYRGSQGGSLVHSGMVQGGSGGASTMAFYTKLAQPNSTHLSTDQLLNDGETLYDQYASVAISQVSHTSTSAQIKVAPIPTVCVKNPPTFSVPSTPTQQDGNFSYYPSYLINNDSPLCKATTFGLSASNLPQGWSVKFVVQNYSNNLSGAQVISDVATVGPVGQKIEITIVVIHPNGLAGAIPLNFVATDIADPTHTSGGVDIKANNSDGPVTLNAGQDLTLSWTSANATNCTFGAPFNGGVLLNGSATLNSTHPYYPTATTTFSIACFNGSQPAGSDSVTVIPASVVRPLVTVPPTFSINSTSIAAFGANQSGSVNSTSTITATFSVTVQAGSANVLFGTQASSIPMFKFKIFDAFGNDVTTSLGQTTSSGFIVPSGAFVTNGLVANTFMLPQQQSGAINNVTFSFQGKDMNGQPLTAGPYSVAISSINYTPNNTTQSQSFDGQQAWRTAGILVPSIVPVTPTPNIPITPNIPPTVTLTANPTTITAGQNVTLTWSSTNATSCAGGNWTPNGINGTMSVPVSVSGFLTISCSNSAGSSGQKVYVTVNPSLLTPPTPTVTSFVPSPSTINAGQSSSLTLNTTTNSSYCILSVGGVNQSWQTNNIVGNVSTYLSQVSPSQTTIYTATCYNSANQSVSQGVTVTVNPVSTTTAPAVVFTANSAKSLLTINNGATVTLSWNVTGATTCQLTDGFSMNHTIGPSGILKDTPVNNPTTYTITCTNTGGTTSKSVTVTVNGGIANANQLDQMAGVLAAIQMLITQLRGW